MDRFTHSEFSRAEEADSPAAWLQPGAAVLIGTTGGAGMWSVVVALPTVQAEFGVARADASLPFTFTMIGFAFGGVAMGRLSDRFGIVRPVIGGTLALGLGYVLAGAAARNLWEFALAYGVLIGGGSSVTFGPPRGGLSDWVCRRGARRVGKLFRRNAVAAGRAALHRDGGLALDPRRHRPVLRRDRAAAHLAAARPSFHAPGDRRGGRARHPAAGYACALAARASGAAVRRRPCLLRGDVDAAGAPRRLLRRSRLRRRARRRDALADARVRHRQPHRFRPPRRPHRRHRDARDPGGAPTRRGAALCRLRRTLLALRDLGAVRPVPGRHRADVRRHHPRLFPAAGSRHAARPGADGHLVRHGARRLGGGPDLRSSRVLPGRVRQRPAVESRQRLDRGVAVAALEPAP